MKAVTNSGGIYCATKCDSHCEKRSLLRYRSKINKYKYLSDSKKITTSSSIMYESVRVILKCGWGHLYGAILVNVDNLFFLIRDKKEIKKS